MLMKTDRNQHSDMPWKPSTAMETYYQDLAFRHRLKLCLLVIHLEYQEKVSHDKVFFYNFNVIRVSVELRVDISLTIDFPKKIICLTYIINKNQHNIITQSMLPNYQYN